MQLFGTLEYKGGMTFSDYATRSYRFTVTKGKYKGVVIHQDIIAPRINEFEWGEQENTYWIEPFSIQKFKSIEAVIRCLDSRTKPLKNEVSNT